MVEAFSRHGWPRTIISDNGSSLKNQLLSELCRYTGVKHRFTTVRHPQANGAAERLIGTIKRALETLGAKYNSTWEERLPMIMLALRQTPRPPLNLSPAQIVYGRQVSGPAEVELNWDPLELTPVDSWIYQRLKIYRETRIELSEALNEQRLNRPQPGKSRPPAELQPGDLVLVFNPEALISETRGLRFKWKGPHVVHRRTGAVNYLIWEDGKLKVFHLSRIIPYDPSGLTEENPVLEQVKELRRSIKHS
jgi:hypothetical protein